MDYSVSLWLPEAKFSPQDPLGPVPQTGVNMASDHLHDSLLDATLS